MSAMTTHEEVNQSNTDIPESTILAEQVLQIYSAIFTTIITTVINSSILIFILWPVIDHTILLMWFTVILIISLVRGVSAHQYKIENPSVEKANFWFRRFFIGSSLASLVWGASAIWLFPENDLARQVFLAFAIAGIAAGAVTSLSYIKLAVYSYLGFSLTPLLVRFFYSGTELGITMGFMIALYLIMLLFAANRNHTNTKQNICMKIKSIERERLLKSKTEQLQSVISSAPIVLWSYDSNGIFTLSEGRALDEIGLKSGQVVGESVFELYAEYPDVINAAKRVLLGETFDSETVVNGRIYINHYTPYYNEQNEIIGCIGVAVDNTERKKIEISLIESKEEAEYANQAKSEFLTHMSHELRTPMNAVLGFSGLLELDKTLSDTNKEHVREIIKGGNHLMEMITQLLDLSEIESGEIDVSLEDYDLHNIINESLLLIESLVDQRNIKIVNKINPQTNYSINVDPTRFKQVIISLLSNAIKYNKVNGTVTLSCDLMDNNQLRINICDTGKGLTEQEQHNLFKSFERIGDYKGIDGVGIGLAITKNLIERMGGKVGVESEVGKGSCFWVKIPLS